MAWGRGLRPGLEESERHRDDGATKKKEPKNYRLKAHNEDMKRKGRQVVTLLKTYHSILRASKQSPIKNQFEHRQKKETKPGFQNEDTKHVYEAKPLSTYSTTSEWRFHKTRTLSASEQEHFPW